jgi:hypothetical protein
MVAEYRAEIEKLRERREQVLAEIINQNKNMAPNHLPEE